MEFFLSSVFILIFGAVVSFLLIPKFSPTVVLVIAAALLGFAVYHHMSLFKNEYKLSTWQTGLIAYAPFIVLGAMILFILGYIFTKYRGGEVPVPDISNMPSAAETMNTLANNVNNSVTNATSVKTDSLEIIKLMKSIDAKFDEELQAIKDLAKATTDFHTSFKAGSGGSGSSGGAGGAGGSKSTASVKDLSSGGGSLIIPTDKRIWVGIAAFSKTAQKQISNAIQMSGCCAALSKSMSKSRKSSVKADSVFSLSEKSGTSSARAAGKAARTSSATGKSVDLDAVDESSKKSAGFKMGALLALETFKTFTGNLVEAYDFNYMKIFDNQFANSRNYIESSNMLIHEQIGYGASDLKIAASYRDITDTITWVITCHYPNFTLEVHTR